MDLVRVGDAGVYSREVGHALKSAIIWMRKEGRTK